MEDVYVINKNIDRPLIFKGLKAQYIYYYLGVIVGCFIVFVGLNTSGVSTMITLIVTVAVLILGIQTVTIISNKFGEDGLMKYLAKRKLPKYIQIDSREYFLNLKK
jgi:hypothetical protein